MMKLAGPFTLETATNREWLLPNGVGGYASATICGMLSRRYHGLLVAALTPPGGRTVLVAKLEEELLVDDICAAISTNEYPDVHYPLGYVYLTEFVLDADQATMRFVVGNTILEKQISAFQGENTTRIQYRNVGEAPFSLRLTALVNARDFHGETAYGSINFTTEVIRAAAGPAVHVLPDWMPEGYWLYADSGTWEDNPTWYANMTYCWERQRGLTAEDNHFSPGRFVVHLDPGAGVTIILSTQEPALAPGVVLPAEHSNTDQETSAQDPPEITRLHRTADSFLVTRASAGQEHLPGGRTVIAGYHWFGDWGRDTMIALPGLCYSTGRLREAAEILRTFAVARQHGLLPNLFQEFGYGAAYNTVDAALWFVYALQQWYACSHDRTLVEELRPALEEIMHCYRTGTDFGIHMDTDGLIEASAPGWQLTWMDAKVGDWVVTPRMGKPVEINALWYNALRVMASFAHDFGWPGDYNELADVVRTRFSAYWYPDGGYLYDVLSATPDRRLRPNQIFAVSLPFSPLDAAQARAVVDVVTRHLLTPYGLRTLAPDDPEYHGQYGGDTLTRDGAYHQGTVWAWLIGPYIDAYLRVHEYTAEAKSAGRLILSPLLAHLWDAGLGSISEIFDGDFPHRPCGTVSQAWSVAEVLRAWEKCRTEFAD